MLATRIVHAGAMGCSFNHTPSLADIAAAKFETYLEPLPTRPQPGSRKSVIVRPIGDVYPSTDEAWAQMPASTIHSGAVALWQMEKGHLSLDMDAAIADFDSLLNNKFKVAVLTEVEGRDVVCWMNFPGQLKVAFDAWEGNGLSIGGGRAAKWAVTVETGPSLRWFDVRISASTVYHATILNSLSSREVDDYVRFKREFPPPIPKGGGCQHEWINVSAFFKHMVCKHCDMEMPDA